ncbi:piggyBac transposable element-derived 4-like protein [Trichonephila clavipes]|nr:piggyBac transposable element-derived 4-like protein [Trichonephila clavipes]
MMEQVGKSSPLEVVRVEELLNIMFSEKKVAQPVMQKEEAHRQQGENEWSTTLDKLDVFISILYAQGPYLTIDERLFPSKARCCFTQCMPSKPDKFGIKFWLAADVDSKYVFNGFPYLCKDEERPVNLSLSEYIVLCLRKSFENKARNITTDNFFATLNLSQMLKMKNTKFN